MCAMHYCFEQPGRDRDRWTSKQDAGPTLLISLLDGHQPRLLGLLNNILNLVQN